ncbi:MAG: SCO family protein [Planctomycetota bacterium]|nr:MAG: SCO family protein [Planctomycetota bacterium]
MILSQVKTAVAALTEEEKKNLVILAITLDPERDTVSVLKKMAVAQGVSTPFFHFLTGDPKRVNHVLDLYNFARTRDPKTGVINHANLFLLFDQKGYLSYRFSLGKQQTDWLIQGLKVLIHEIMNNRKKEENKTL